MTWIVRRRNSRSSAVGFTLHVVSVQSLFPDDPRRTFAELLRRQETDFDHAANGRRTDGKDVCGFIERNLAAGLSFAFLIERDALLGSDRTYAHSRPGVTATGLFPGPVQHGSDGLVRHLPSKRLDKVDHIVVIRQRV